jgi:hypothetical protein
VHGVDDEVTARQNDRHTDKKWYEKNWHSKSPFVGRAAYTTCYTALSAANRYKHISGSTRNHTPCKRKRPR